MKTTLSASAALLSLMFGNNRYMSDRGRRGLARHRGGKRYDSVRLEDTSVPPPRREAMDCIERRARVTSISTGNPVHPVLRLAVIGELEQGPLGLLLRCVHDQSKQLSDALADNRLLVERVGIVSRKYVELRVKIDAASLRQRLRYLFTGRLDHDD